MAFNIKKDNVNLRTIVNYIHKQDKWKNMDLSVLEEKIQMRIDNFMGIDTNFEEVLCDIILNDLENGYNISEDIVIFLKIYDFFIHKEGIINNDTYKDICNLAIKFHDVLMNDNITNLMMVFDGTLYFSETLKFIFMDKKLDMNKLKRENFDVLFKFILSIKQYYPNNDSGYFSTVYDIVNRIGYSILYYGSNEEVKDICNKIHLEIKQANFIYDDIDYGSLELKRLALSKLVGQVDALTVDANGVIKRLGQSVLEADTSAKKIKGDVGKTVAEAENFVKLQKKELKIYVDGLINGISDYASNAEKLMWRNILEEWGKIRIEYDSEITKKIDEVNGIALNITNTKNGAIREIRDLKEHLINDLQGCKTSILENIEKKEKELEDKITNFNGRYTSFDDLLDICEEIKKNKILQEKLEYQEKVIKNPHEYSKYGKVISLSEKADFNSSDEIDYSINYFMDSEYSNEERVKSLKYIINEYNNMSDKKYYMHKAFDTAVSQFIDGIPLCIYGPSGSGKTFMVEMISYFMGIEVLSNQFIDFPHRIEGFMAANGAFVPSLLYKAYKEGLFYCVNEFDRSDPATAMLINEFAEMTSKDKIAFPNGEVVHRHPNFRLIVTSNTDLMGSNQSEYTSARRQDGATTERFVVMETCYDRAVEDKLLSDIHDYSERIKWQDFISVYRSFSNNKNKIKGEFTTRDAVRLIRYKNDLNYIISDETIMYLLFIQQNLHDEDTRKKLCDYMRDNLRDGRGLYESFERAWDLDNIYNKIDLSDDDYKRFSQEDSPQQKILKRILRK